MFSVSVTLSKSEDEKSNKSMLSRQCNILLFICMAEKQF